MFFWFNQNGKQTVDYPQEQNKIKEELTTSNILLSPFSTGTLILLMSYLLL